MNGRSLAIRSLEWASRLAGGTNRLLVLTYHRVLAERDPLYPSAPDAGGFRAAMQALVEDFHVLPLAEALALQARRQLPPGAVAVTFDDGFADNVTVALPILRELRVPAIFFIATGYLDGGIMFNNAVIEACRAAPTGTWDTGTAAFGTVVVGAHSEARRVLAQRMIMQLKYAEPDARRACAAQLLASAGGSRSPDIMMTRAQVRQLHDAGMAIGGHTASHPILARLPDDTAAREIRRGKEDLEAITGSRIDLFAYPNGQPNVDYGLRDAELVRAAGFMAAVTTAWGYSDPRTDRFQIPRVGSWGRDQWRFSLRLASARAFSRGRACSVAAGVR